MKDDWGKDYRERRCLMKYWGIPLLRGPEEEPKDSPNGQKRRRKTAEDKPEKSQ